MKRILIEAPEIGAIGYSPCASVLEIEFKDGEVWQFLGVPTSVHDALWAAPSKESYFNAHIREQFPNRPLAA